MTYDYPIWYILLSLLISGVLSFLMYKKNIKTSWKYSFMAFLRFTTLLVLFISIGELLLISKVESKLKPKLIVAFDQSRSMIDNANSIDLNSIFYKLNSKEVSSNYDIENIGFGSSVFKIDTLSFDANRTNFKKLEDKLGLISTSDSRVIIVSDGNINKGGLYVFRNPKKYIVDVVGVGDTISKSSLNITKIHHNKNVVLKNTFPIEVFLETEDVSGNVKLEVSENEQIVFTDNISIQQSQFAKVASRYSFVMKAKKEGMHAYILKLTSQSDKSVFSEKSTSINVVKNKGRVLIKYSELSPDISLFKRNLVDRNYEVIVSNNDFGSKSINKYDFVVDFGNSLTNKLNVPKVSVLTHPQKLNKQNKEIDIGLSSKQVNYFGVNSNSKTINIEIDNLWKFNLKEAKLGNKKVDDFFDLLIKEIELLRYSDKFNVIYNDVYSTNENVILKLVNSTSSIKDVEAKAELFIGGKNQKFDFIGNDGSYSLNLGKLNESEYSVKIIINNKVIKVITFDVKEIDFESLNKGQNVDLLKNIATKQKSNYYNSSDIKMLLNDLEDESIVKSSYKTLKNNLLGQWWFLILIPLFLGLEWFLRKRNGLY